jgi:hypothetical protein
VCTGIYFVAERGLSRFLRDLAHTLLTRNRAVGVRTRISSQSYVGLHRTVSDGANRFPLPFQGLLQLSRDVVAVFRRPVGIKFCTTTLLLLLLAMFVNL